MKQAALLQPVHLHVQQPVHKGQLTAFTEVFKGQLIAFAGVLKRWLIAFTGVLERQASAFSGVFWGQARAFFGVLRGQACAFDHFVPSMCVAAELDTGSRRELHQKLEGILGTSQARLSHINRQKGHLAPYHVSND